MASPRPDALAAIALGIGDLVELLEDLRLLVLGNAAARVPDLRRSAIWPRSPAADQHAAAVGVGDGIGDDVAHHALDQQRIAVHGGRSSAAARSSIFFASASPA